MRCTVNFFWQPWVPYLFLYFFASVRIAFLRDLLIPSLNCQCEAPLSFARAAFPHFLPHTKTALQWVWTVYHNSLFAMPTTPFQVPGISQTCVHQRNPLLSLCMSISLTSLGCKILTTVMVGFHYLGKNITEVFDVKLKNT